MLGKHLAECKECKPDEGEFCAAWPGLLEMAMDAHEFPTALDVIGAGECPRKAETPVACFLCSWGHITECHAPQTCAEAKCGHYMKEILFGAEFRPARAIAEKILAGSGGLAYQVED